MKKNVNDEEIEENQWINTFYSKTNSKIVFISTTYFERASWRPKLIRHAVRKRQDVIFTFGEKFCSQLQSCTVHVTIVSYRDCWLNSNEQELFFLFFSKKGFMSIFRLSNVLSNWHTNSRFNWIRQRKIRVNIEKRRKIAINLNTYRLQSC